MQEAIDAVRSGRPLLVTAGAGLGVDGGLPDFRGPGGWWGDQRLEERATAAWFDDDPAEAWAFYRGRRALYASTPPHPGYAVLIERAGFVFTSNVDGHFVRAGLDPDRIVEIHGSLERLQCATPCSRSTWPTEDALPFPLCPRCGGPARPNVCVFDDRRWIAVPSVLQGRRYDSWLGDHPDPVVLELGAGTAVPNVRREGERLQGLGATLVRVNPHEAEGPPGTLSVAIGALAFLSAVG
ncbi:MAG: NAD-dependent deacetylase [Alphaproteobacteria bacterium]|nr:NAD-dependent deacetylase [Alphaproteobacteria bacterium]MCB9691907.1 NAD-dependent deacetylase [Alphaproteobacteria bacterium]